MKQVLELFTTILAFGIGLFLFQKLNLFLRLLFVQVSVCLLVECFAIPINPNVWLYNLVVPVEAALLCYAGRVYFKTVKSRISINCLYAVFIMVYLADVFWFTGLDKLAAHAVIIEGFSMTAIYTFLLYEVLMNRRGQKVDISTTLASLGMVLYFACTVPYLCVVTYFQEQDSALNDVIFQYVITPLASLRYLFIAIAFYKRANEKSEILETTNAIK